MEIARGTYWATALLVLASVGRAQGQEAPEPAPEPTNAGPGADVTPEAGAVAEPPSADADQATRELEAKQHFRLGSTFYDSGRFQEAAEEFAEAFRLSGRPELLYNVYVARRDAGKLEEAVDALRSYLKAMPNAPDRINLRARLESMEAQLAAHQEREAVEKEPARAATEPVETEHSVVPWVLMGTGGALLAVSIGTGVAAKSGADKLAERCNSDRECPSAEEGLIAKTQALALTTDVLWAVGAGAAVTGLVLWLTGALDEEQPVQMALSAGQRSARLSFSGRF